MRTVTVTVPAVAAMEGFGLALALHNTLELRTRSDSLVTVSHHGVGAYPPTADHPAAKGVEALFSLWHNRTSSLASETATSASASLARPGIDLFCQGNIPAGLGDKASWFVAGMFAGNNLLDTPFHRDQIAQALGTLTEHPETALTAMAGGLVVTTTGPKERPILYRRVELTTTLSVVLTLPEIAAPKKRKLPESVHRSPALLLVDMLRTGDLREVDWVLQAPSALKTLNPVYEAADIAAKQAGAAGVTLVGDGPMLMIFAKKQHERIEGAVKAAFDKARVNAQTWVVNVDTQGVTITVQR